MDPWTKLRIAGALLGCAGAFIVAAAPGGAAEILKAASYPGMTTFECRSDAIPIYPGQNLNLYTTIKTCANAKKVQGSGPVSASTFDPGSTAQGYITRFKPSMVEIKDSGKLVTPSVWDLHLHHIVWLGPNNQRFGAGEEKTVGKAPLGYGGKVAADHNWALNYMIHSLNAASGKSDQCDPAPGTGPPPRCVYITWEIDWVPETNPPRTDIVATKGAWLDVAGTPQVYPVFDAERGFDSDGDGEFVFPDDALDPSDPAFAEENDKISPNARWVVPDGGVTAVSAGGHLHPGGLHVDMEVARDLDDSGVAGDIASEVKPLFRSDAKYYEPAGAVSWDVSMEVTRPEWRISLKEGDVVSIDATYDVEKASWYESMGIMPLSYTTQDDPAARDPFDDAAEVEAMYDAGGILTHGRLEENIDAQARKDLGLPDPRDLRARGEVPTGGIDIDGFRYQDGGYSATGATPTSRMRPPTISPGETVTFNNLDAASAAVPQVDQAWHSITSCKAPCNKGSGIGYPLASGPIKFDSGQLGFGSGLSSEVTTGTQSYETPPLTDPGTYTYFCRIHPSMRGSIRVAEE